MDIVVNLDNIVLVLESALISTITGFFVTAIAYKFARNRLKALAFGWGSEFKNLIFAELERNPEIIVKMMDPVVKRLLATYGVQESGKTGDMRVFGMKIPGWLAQEGFKRIIGKAGFGGEKGAETPTSPFEEV